MYLIYFDENKYSEDSPYFFIGGVLLNEKKLNLIESTLTDIQYNFFGTGMLSHDIELHGIDLFHGKKKFKNKPLAERIELLHQITDCLVSNDIPIRLVCIDVNAYKTLSNELKNEYKLGLKLILESFCDYLKKANDIAIVFGDHEPQETPCSILSFAHYKFFGKTHMYLGRPFGRLKDTIYYTHSHHSRFLQLADLIVYLANRYEHSSKKLIKWHEIEAQKMWDTLKQKTDFEILNWPEDIVTIEQGIENGATSLI